MGRDSGVQPGRVEGWQISPVLPTIANCLLAALWGLSAYGGWGDTAFCAVDGGASNAACSQGFMDAVHWSLIAVVPAVLLAVGAWTFVRQNTDRLDLLLTISAGLWVAAEGILFVGGYIAQP
jgi:hypothetical protein